MSAIALSQKYEGKDIAPIYNTSSPLVITIKMVTFQEYLATMKLHTGDHKGGRLLHAVCQGIDVNTVNFLYLSQYKTEVAHVIN